MLYAPPLPPPLPRSASGGHVATQSLKDHWKHTWQVYREPAELSDFILPNDSGGLLPAGDARKRVLAFRGLRVRMGMSCGFQACDVNVNKTTSRAQYSGMEAQVARGVCDAAQVVGGTCGLAIFSELAAGILPCFSYGGALCRLHGVVRACFLIRNPIMPRSSPPPSSLFSSRF